MSDVYNWIAYYNDGTILQEIDPEGDHGFADIDHSKLVQFLLVPQKEGFYPVVVSINVAEGQRLIFFRRTKIDFNITNGTESHRDRITCVGYQQTVQGTNVSVYNFIMPDGTSMLSNDHNAV